MYHHLRLSKKRSLHIPVSSRVILHRHFLQKLLKAAKKPKALEELLSTATTGELNAVSECCRNILQRNIPKASEKRIIARLFPFKDLIRKVAHSKTSAAVKRRLLLKHTNLQSGGLPLLLPFLAPILGTLVSAGVEAAIRK